MALNAGGTRNLHTRNIIIATGGQARSIPGVTPDGERVLTYREAIVLRDLPASAVIVGAGPIGMEFAHVWQHLWRGCHRRRDAAPGAAPGGRGGQHRRGARFQAAQGQAADRHPGRGHRARGRRRCRSAWPTTKGEQVLEAERVLIAIGVQPNSANLGLESIGVQDRAGQHRCGRVRCAPTCPACMPSAT